MKLCFISLTSVQCSDNRVENKLRCFYFGSYFPHFLGDFTAVKRGTKLFCEEVSQSESQYMALITSLLECNRATSLAAVASYTAVAILASYTTLAILYCNSSELCSNAS